MPAPTPPGPVAASVSPSAEQWWAVEISLLRTGRRQIIYVQAQTAQQAVQTEPGSTLLGGPFPTEAAAQAAFPGGSAGSTPPPAGQTTPPTLSTTPVNIPNPFAGQLELAHWIGEFITALTDIHMWISLGWLLLGLLLIGIAVWTLGRQTDIIPNVVPVPAPV